MIKYIPVPFLLTMTVHAAPGSSAASSRTAKFADDESFLKVHTDIVVLSRVDAAVVLASAYQ